MTDLSNNSVPAGLPDRMDCARDAQVEAFVRFLRTEKNASEHTVSGYVQDIGQFAEFRWPKAKQPEPPFVWTEVSRDDARNFLIAFNKSGVEPATTRRKLSSLRTFFTYLERENILQANPFSGLHGPRLGKRLPVVLGIPEVEALLAAPLHDLEKKRSAPHGPSLAEEYACLRDAAIFEVLYSTGCRVSEIAALSWGGLQNISLDKGGTVVVEGKGRKQRLCVLGPPGLPRNFGHARSGRENPG